jgi:hypothetical protein
MDPITNSAFVDQLGLSGLAVGLIQLLKATPWVGWVNRHSDALNRSLSVAMAIFTAVGIQMVISGGLQTGGSITITFPSLSVMGQTLLRFVAQLVMQEITYRSVAKPITDK